MLCVPRPRFVCCRIFKYFQASLSSKIWIFFMDPALSTQKYLHVESSKVCSTSIAIYFPRRESTISLYQDYIVTEYWTGCPGFYFNLVYIHEKNVVLSSQFHRFGFSATDLFIAKSKIIEKRRTSIQIKYFCAWNGRHEASLQICIP